MVDSFNSGNPQTWLVKPITWYRAIKKSWFQKYFNDRGCALGKASEKVHAASYAL